MLPKFQSDTKKKGEFVPSLRKKEGSIRKILVLMRYTIYCEASIYKYVINGANNK